MQRKSSFELSLRKVDTKIKYTMESVTFIINCNMCTKFHVLTKSTETLKLDFLWKEAP